MDKINISDKLRIFDKYWQSKIVGEFNGQSVKLIKMKGEFDWHQHKLEDELLIILLGSMKVQLHDTIIVLKDGDLFIIPSGAQHKLIAAEEVHVMTVEPKSTINTEQSQTS